MSVDKQLDYLIRGCFYALIFFLPISIALVSTFAGMAISSTTIAKNTAPAIASTMRFCFNMEIGDA